MSYHHHLLCLLILALNFSGKPLPVGPKTTAHVLTKKNTLFREENKEVIPWVPERRLTWEDFLCDPKTTSDAVASTSTSLGIAYQIERGHLTYTITCHFSKHKSWGLLKTDYILAHEQGHFDITEVCARKLHKALKEYHFDLCGKFATLTKAYGRGKKDSGKRHPAYRISPPGELLRGHEKLCEDAGGIPMLFFCC